MSRSGPADAELQRVRGMALMLLVAVLGGMGGAVVLRVFHGGLYVTVLMPALIGWGLGVTVARVRTRYAVAARWPAFTTAALGALVAYGGYHLLAYLHTTSFLVENLASAMDHAASDPFAEIQLWFEEKTGETGAMAYLAFTAQGSFVHLSPVGLLGRVELGLVGTLVVMGLECLVTVGAGVFFAAGRRPRAAAPAPARASRPRQREVIVRTDGQTLLEAMRSIDAGDFEGAARILAANANPPDAGHALALEFEPGDETSYVLEVCDIDRAGAQHVRATRQLSGWDGQALWDELRLER